MGVGPIRRILDKTLQVHISLIDPYRLPCLLLLQYFDYFVDAVVLLHLVSLTKLAVDEMAPQQPIFAPPAALLVYASHFEIKDYFGRDQVLLQRQPRFDPVLTHRARSVIFDPLLNAQAAKCVAE